MEKLLEKRVKDVMIPINEYPTISAEATLKDAVRVMRNFFETQNQKPPAGPVQVFVVEDNELVGIFGISELLTAVEPQFLKGVAYIGMKMPSSWAIPVFWDGLFTERCMEIAYKRVKEFMYPIEHHIDVNDTLLKASYSMAKYKTDAVSVKSNGRLVGVVSSIDVFREISRIVMHDELALSARNAARSQWMDKLALESS